MEKFNFNRKLFHLIGFFVPGILFFDLFKGAFQLQFASRTIVFFLIIVILFIMSLLEILRLNHEGFNNFYLNNFGAIMKEAEKTRMNGVVPYMLSNAFIVAFFPSEIIFLSMAYLLIGDPVAAYFGSKYGKIRFYNGKSLVGVLSFIIASSVAGVLLMIMFESTNSEYPLSILLDNVLNLRGMFIVFLGAIFAGLAEFLSGHAWKGFLEDNLLIPVVSSIVTTLSLSLLFNMPLNSLLFHSSNLFLKVGSP